MRSLIAWIAFVAASAGAAGYTVKGGRCASSEEAACREVSCGGEADAAVACLKACAAGATIAAVNERSEGDTCSCCCLASCECVEDVENSLVVWRDGVAAPGPCGVGDSTDALEKRMNPRRRLANSSEHT